MAGGLGGKASRMGRAQGCVGLKDGSTSSPEAGDKQAGISAAPFTSLLQTDNCFISRKTVCLVASGLHEYSLRER